MYCLRGPNENKVDNISLPYDPHPSLQPQENYLYSSLSVSLALSLPSTSLAMATLAKHLILCSTATSSSSSASSPTSARRRGTASQADAAAAAGERHQRGGPQSATRRLAVAASTALAATAALSARRPAAPPPAMAAEAAAVPPPPPGPGTVPRWGTRSYVRERFFEPGLTAEEAAARIRQTAEGMRTLRPMLETMSWKYVLFYVRLKSKYLDLDLTTAMFSVPEARRADYVRVANELVDNMTEVSLVYYTFPNEIKLT